MFVYLLYFLFVQVKVCPFFCFCQPAVLSVTFDAATEHLPLFVLRVSIQYVSFEQDGQEGFITTTIVYSRYCRI